MKYRQIGLGTKIELELYDNGGNRIRPVLISQYETYDEESDVVQIHAPFSEGNIYPLHQYTIMDVIFSKENDTYMFKAEAVRRFKQGSIAMLIIKPLTPIRKIQRRSFFRMECVLDIRYRVYVTIISDDKTQGEFSRTITKDISGGGVCILTDEKLEKASYIEAFLKLDKEIHFIGKITRSNRISVRGKVMYETGVEYKRINNSDREKIISYVFEIQRSRLKRGWMKK